MAAATDPKAIFSTAETFRVGSAVLAGHLPVLMFPWVICSSFGLELYLKSLILLEGGAVGRGHDLEALFSKVSPASREAIRKSYEPKRAKQEARFAASNLPQLPKTGFDFVLHASARAFENFRYAYEGKVKDQEGWLAGLISECVRERMLEFHPDWANLPR